MNRKIACWLLPLLAAFPVAAEDADAVRRFETTMHDGIAVPMRAALEATGQLEGRSPAEADAFVADYASTVASCTAGALELYPARVREEGLDAVRRGAAYAEVKLAMDTTLREELAAGGERANAVETAIANIAQSVKACMGERFDVGRASAEAR